MSSVLLVDENPDARAAVRSILTGGGFSVHELEQGAGVAEHVRQLRPLVVILSAGLPDLDGCSACRALKQDALLASTPVLLLTPHDDLPDIEAGLDAGADDYVARDAAPRLILARVRRLVHDRQMTMIAALNQHLVQLGQLLAGIVHEIRSPLSVIRGNAEMLLMVFDDRPDLSRYVDPIVRNSLVMQQRLEHLMAAVRGGPAKLNAQRVEPIVNEATELFLKGADPRRNRIAVTTQMDAPLPPINADAGRLIQVLMNLLCNAAEAVLSVRTQGQITVRARRQERDHVDGVAIEVLDNGPGIPDSHLSRIFEPFFTTKPEGSGYGLYLASEILREHGGRLEAANHGPCGACFTLWLPISPTKTLEREPAAAASESALKQHPHGDSNPGP